MRAGRVVTTALLLKLAAVSPAIAVPITDPTSLAQHAGYDSALFDSSGNPFLLTGAPIYFQLDFGGGSGDENGGSSDHVPAGNGSSIGGNPLVDGIVNSYFALSSSSPNGPGETSVSGSTNSDSLSNLIAGSPGTGGPAGGSQNTVSIAGDDFNAPGQTVVPEPATLLLVGSGIGAALRRRFRADRTV